MSGGGRCNFTNYNIDPENFISHNPHFCKSAISRYTQWDFIALVSDYNIPFNERKHGQLFCDDSSKDILAMLLSECTAAGVEIRLACSISNVDKNEGGHFKVASSLGEFTSESLVIATGGLSIPKMGATPFGYQLAEQFGHHIWPTSAGLVPFTVHDADKSWLAELSGIAIDCVVTNERASFSESILLTHRGLSGPAILQISSYWKAGEAVEINLLPELDVYDFLTTQQAEHPNSTLKNTFSSHLPKRFLGAYLGDDAENTLQTFSHQRFKDIALKLNAWALKPNSTEGYRTAEVTLGGVDCDEISSQSMESKKASNLYFIGEVVDVTGWLGGYNFQWSWSSGWCAGQVV
jgi:predicted Rossmann fold flavoprotein